MDFNGITWITISCAFDGQNTNEVLPRFYITIKFHNMEYVLVVSEIVQAFSMKYRNKEREKEV